MLATQPNQTEALLRQAIEAKMPETELLKILHLCGPANATSKLQALWLQILCSLGRHSEALQRIEEFKTHHGDGFLLAFNEAAIHGFLNNEAGKIAALTRATTWDPNDMEAWTALAECLALRADSGDADAAINMLEAKDAELKACADHGLLIRAANTLRACEDPRAREWMRTAVEVASLRFRGLEGAVKETLMHLADLVGSQRLIASDGDCRQEIARIQSTLEKLQVAPELQGFAREVMENLLVSIGNFYWPYLTEEDKRLSESYARFIERQQTTLRLKPPMARSSTPRLGVMGSFIHHPDSFTFSLVNDFLQTHSEIPWEVVYLDIGSDCKLRGHAHKLGEAHCLYGPVGEGNIAEAAANTATLGLSALMFTEIGMFSPTRLLSFYRMAPLQFTTWLHPQTTASPEIDWFLSGELMEPEAADSHYTERLIRLPGIGQRLSPTLPKGYEAPSVKPGSLGCLQSHFKLQPFFDAWMDDILRALPDADLALLSPPTQRQMKQLRERHARLPDIARRASALPKMPRVDYLQTLASLDVSLDSPSWAGGNTTADALMVGTPVVVYAGNRMRSRHGVGIMTMIGCEDLITESREAYVAKVVELVNDRAYNTDVRRRIAEGRDRLFTDKRPGRALRLMLDDWYRQRQD